MGASMVGIVQSGIVRVAENGEAMIVRPGKNGGNPTAISISQEITERYRLATGDVVEGETQSLMYADCYEDNLEAGDAQLLPVEEDVDLQYDEPIVSRSANVLIPTARWMTFPSETLLNIVRINGLEAEAGEAGQYSKT